jgi:hypothetical protein
VNRLGADQHGHVITQIHQILMNLYNAAYAMREEIILDLSLTPVEVDAEMVNRHWT